MATATTTTGQPPRFSVVALDEAGVRIIVITGELDVATTPQLQVHLEEARAGHGAVLADLCAVEFMDSSGARLLWEAHNAITGQARRFAVSLLNGAAPKRVLTLTGLDALIAHHPDRVTAINALRA